MEWGGLYTSRTSRGPVTMEVLMRGHVCPFHPQRGDVARVAVGSFDVMRSYALLRSRAPLHERGFL